MSNQIFKTPVPINILHDLLEKICLKTDKYYFLDETAYRKMLFHEMEKPFLELIRPYYFASKLFYLNRDFTYNSFTNIVRQICKFMEIKLESEIKYCHSKYYINFFIYW